MKRKSLVVLLIIVMLLMVCTSVKADFSVGMKMSSDSKLVAGDTVVVTASLTSINAGSGIDTITGKLTYDKSVFETLTQADISANGWNMTYAPETDMITFIKNSKVTSAETVFTVTLKVKESFAKSTAQVQLSEIIASGGSVAMGGTGDINVNSISVTLSKDSSAVSGEEQSTPSTNDNALSGSSSTGSKTSNKTIKDNTVTAKSTLPKTGISQQVIIAIVVFGIVAIFCYAIYKKISKDVK